MNTFLGLLLFAAAVCVLVLVQKWLRRGVGVAWGAATGNSRARGLRAVRLQTDFTAPVTCQEFTSALLRLLDLPTSASFKHPLYIGGVSADKSQIRVHAGNPVSTQMEFVIDTNPTEGGCSGEATTLKWTESDGIIAATEQAERMHKYVRSAVTAAGGQFTESESR